MGIPIVLQNQQKDDWMPPRVDFTPLYPHLSLPTLLWPEFELLGQQVPTPPFSVSDYHKSLEDALSSDTSGHFKRILISLATVSEFMGPGRRGSIAESRRGCLPSCLLSVPPPALVVHFSKLAWCHLLQAALFDGHQPGFGGPQLIGQGNMGDLLL